LKLINQYEAGCDVLATGEDLYILYHSVMQPAGLVSDDDLPSLTGFEGSDLWQLAQRIGTKLPCWRGGEKWREIETFINFTNKELNIIVAGCRATLTIISDAEFHSLTGYERSDMERILQEFLPLVDSEPK